MQGISSKAVAYSVKSVKTLIRQINRTGSTAALYDALDCFNKASNVKTKAK